MRIAILLTNPIQHEVPFLQALEKNKLTHEIEVIYYSDEGIGNFNYFGLTNISYGIPMLYGYKYIILRNFSPFKNYKFRFISPGIIKTLFRGKYDLILMYGYQSPTSLLAIIYAKIYGIPILQRSEGESIQNISDLKKIFRKMIYPPIYSCFNGFTALCMANKNHYLEYGIKELDISLIPQTINDEFFSKPNIEKYTLLKLKYGLQEDDIVYIYGSKLRIEKSPLDAIKAFCMLDRNTKAKLIMLSDGPERKICEEYVQQNRFTDKIIFTGYIPFEDMRDLFNIADVLLMTSSETIGTTLYQAIFSSLAIISSDKVPAYQDLILKDKNGFIYPYGNINELYNCINYLVNHKELIPCMKNYSKQLSYSYTANKSSQLFYEFIKKRFII